MAILIALLWVLLGLIILGVVLYVAQRYIVPAAPEELRPATMALIAIILIVLFIIFLMRINVIPSL